MRYIVVYDILSNTRYLLSEEKMKKQKGVESYCILLPKNKKKDYMPMLNNPVLKMNKLQFKNDSEALHWFYKTYNKVEGDENYD